MKKKINILIIAISFFMMTMPCCKKFEFTVPEVTTGKIESGFGSATCENTLISDGGYSILSRGVSWSTDPNFTIEHTIDKDTTVNDYYYYGYSHYYDDNTTLTYKLTGLHPGTTYYARAFAKNSIGISYGNAVSFITKGYTETISDIDGNVYNCVTIGSQEWMVENLKTSKYRNGDPISNVIVSNDWATLSTGAYCDYNNDPANSTIYGKLYNWYAVTDSRNIAPVGWHMPTEADWITLINYLGRNSLAGNKLTECGTEHWLNNNMNATNDVGFTAIPGGCRYYNNGSYPFGDKGYAAYWWSNSAFSSFDAYFFQLDKKYSYPYDQYNITYHVAIKKNGFSVRCVKD